MKRIVSLLTLLLSSYLFSNAQTAEDSVKVAVNRLFESMIKSDAGMLTAAFADSAILQTIATNKEGKVIIRNESVAEFAQGISKLPPGAADERITFDVIRIDGALAIAWASGSSSVSRFFSSARAARRPDRGPNPGSFASNWMSRSISCPACDPATMNSAAPHPEAL